MTDTFRHFNESDEPSTSNTYLQRVGQRALAKKQITTALRPQHSEFQSHRGTSWILRRRMPCGFDEGSESCSRLMRCGSQDERGVGHRQKKCNVVKELRRIYERARVLLRYFEEDV